MDLELSHFNTFDLLILVCLLFSMIVGFIRGFIREALGVTAWCVAGYLALQEYEAPRNFLSQWLRDPYLLRIGSVALVFCLTLALLLLLAQVLSHMVKNSLALSIDRSLGVIFGFGRGFLLVCGIYLASLLYVGPEEQPLLLRLSRSASWLNISAIWMFAHLPSSLIKEERFRKNMEKIRGPVISAEKLASEIAEPKPSSEAGEEDFISPVSP